MNIRSIKRILIFIVSVILPAVMPRHGWTQPELDSIALPPGFSIGIYASGVKGCRSLALGSNGTVFCGTRNEGVVYAALDRNRDNIAEDVVVVARGLTMPNGVAFRKGSLYVSEVSRIVRFDDIEKNLYSPSKPVIVNHSFPKDRHHGWKFISFGPDDFLYVPVGAPCNVCDSEDPRYATIMRMKPDGKGLEIFARGVRNTVGFDWDPRTGDLWFTDNGRDMMGDDVPPDELNHAPDKGMHFGFPFRHGAGIVDPQYGADLNEKNITPPVVELGAHVASLGMRFYTGDMFPGQYKNRIFIAEHGSWNRSVPSGYRVTMVTIEEGKPPEYEVFAQGWLQKQGPWGRPVDILIMPDGALLVSDDMAGVIYRISYSQPLEKLP